MYSPVKGEGWKQHFFEWPQEQAKLERHIKDYNERDVYLSPVLFSEPRISPETFKGTNYLWTEFDGVLPPSGYIEPSIKVSSSVEGHEHWYWKLDKFVTDKVLVEDLTRRIAYHYSADLSVWDYQNVLRPPDTWNHKRNKPVTLLNKSSVSYNIDKFLWVPIPPAGTKVDIKLGELPPKLEILAKYQWKHDTLDLLFKVIDQGGRSAALMRLAYDAIEVGCSNEEIYVLLEDRDSVWGKYVGRSDREKRLETTIARARGKKAVTAEIVQGSTEVYRFHDFMKTNIVIKWAIEGLLPVAGSMIIVGKPGVGKSTFALRKAMSLALGEEYFLNWKIVDRQKTLFISLEMQHDELKSFFEDMKLPEEKQEQLQDWFHIWPIGHAYPLDTPDQQIELLKFIDLHKIELIVIDSLALSMYGAVTNDDDVKRLNSFLNEDVRKNRRCGYVFIHHPRKEGLNLDKKDMTLDDVFGSAYITANAQTVVALSQKSGSPRLNIHFLKTRMTQNAKSLEFERTSDRGFQLVGSVNSTPINDGGKAVSKQEGNGLNLGKIINL